MVGLRLQKLQIDPKPIYYAKQERRRCAGTSAVFLSPQFRGETQRCLFLKA